MVLKQRLETRSLNLNRLSVALLRSLFKCYIHWKIVTFESVVSSLNELQLKTSESYF